MKREDFTIDGIPDGYIVYDVDLTPSGRPVPVLGSQLDEDAEAFVMLPGARIPLPSESIVRSSVSRKLLLYTLVRCAGEDRIVVVRPWDDEERAEPNSFVWSDQGELTASFPLGGGVDEVLAAERSILIFYGDQGQTGDSPIGHHAMVVMSHSGEMVWGHASHFDHDQALDTWFHAAAWAGIGDVAIFADVAVSCVYARVNVRTRDQVLSRPPAPVAQPDAITVRETSVLLHGTILRTSTGIDYSDEIIAWEPDADNWRSVGMFPHKRQTKHIPLRGLPGGRFIAPKPDGYTILSFD